MDALKLLRELVEIDTTINPSEGKYPPNPAALDLVREQRRPSASPAKSLARAG